MSIKLGFAVFVLATALATTTYAASKGGGGSHGGGSHGGGSHGGSSHGGAVTAAVHTPATAAAVTAAATKPKAAMKVTAASARPRWQSARRASPAHFAIRCSGCTWPFAYYAAPDQLALTCGEDVSDIASMPLDQFRDAIHPTEEQAAALDDLALAVTKAVQDIKIACPAEVALTAPGRMAAMQRRIEAMIAAVEIVQPPLEKFYGLLNDEQKAKVNALANAARQGPPGSSRGHGRRTAVLHNSAAWNCRRPRSTKRYT